MNRYLTFLLALSMPVMAADKATIRCPSCGKMASILNVYMAKDSTCRLSLKKGNVVSVSLIKPKPKFTRRTASSTVIHVPSGYTWMRDFSSSHVMEQKLHCGKPFRPPVWISKIVWTKRIKSGREPEKRVSNIESGREKERITDYLIKRRRDKYLYNMPSVRPDKDEYARYKTRQAKLKKGEEVFGHRPRRDDFKEWANQPKIASVKAEKAKPRKRTLIEEFREVKKVVREPEEEDEDEYETVPTEKEKTVKSFMRANKIPRKNIANVRRDYDIFRRR